MNDMDFSYGLHDSKYPSHYDEPLPVKKRRVTIVARPTFLQKLASLWWSARSYLGRLRRPRR